ncbi:MAG: Allantoicase [Hyphomicrobiales bacterium]|nr:Allantoicase [Hyphomicrobiales bacterium]
MTSASQDTPDFARNAVNLASAGLGAKALSVTDDFFAEVNRMLSDAAPVFDPKLYDDNGKYMDGWESKRRRGPGHDHAVVRLAVPGVIRGFDVDTSYFTGNFPPACSIEACNVKGDPDESTAWTEILPVSPLGASAHHFLACTSDSAWTHVRLHIYPDGGVARLRVYGEPWLDRDTLAGKVIDLASALNGGRVIAYSDAHYGAFQRMLSPGRGINMGDGWETRRRRVPGNDWIIVALGGRGILEATEIDTAHYKGNFADKVSIQAADLGRGFDGLDQAVVTASMFWEELLPQKQLSADAIHKFDNLKPLGPITHVRVNIYPDGGISRLRLFGKLAQ